MVEIGPGANQVSRELFQAAKKAAQQADQNGGKIPNATLTKAALADGQFTPAEAQFIKALENQEMVHALQQADFDPQSLNFEAPSQSAEVKDGGAVYGPGSAGSVAEKFYDSEIHYRSASDLSQAVNLDSTSSRLAALNKMSQIGLQPGGSESEQFQANRDKDACGPTSLVAGAVFKGKKGLDALFKVVESRGFSYEVGQPLWDKLPGIKERAQNNQLTQKDLLSLQRIVHGQMRNMEGHSDKTRAINLNVMKDYLNTDLDYIGTHQPLKDVFSDMAIKLIDIDLDGNQAKGTKYDHYVLFFNGAGNSAAETHTFDPWPTKSGNHVTTDNLRYHHAVNEAV